MGVEAVGAIHAQRFCVMTTNRRETRGRRNPNGDRQRTSGVYAATATIEATDRSPFFDDAVELVHRVACGDQNAFSRLYDQLAPLVYGVVLKVLRSPAQAEEVTQEVFVELWRTATRFDGSRSSVRTWAAMVAHRRAVDRVRSEQASRRRDDLDVSYSPAPHDVVVAEVESSIDQYRVRKALASLSDSQREAVELAYFGGRTYREVAVLLGVAEGTVKTRIRDGLIRLRGELGVADG
jgi:RNA polymerase sigma-70 factor (ECF subfamily)